MEDLERFSAQPTEGVCLTAQKSYKSEQIEQIDIDEKIFGGFGKICWIYSPIGSSTRLGEADWESVPRGTEILQIGTNRTNKYR